MGTEALSEGAACDSHVRAGEPIGGTSWVVGVGREGAQVEEQHSEGILALTCSHAHTHLLTLTLCVSGEP